MLPQEITRKKRDVGTLAEAEIMIDGLKNTVSKGQVAAFAKPMILVTPFAFGLKDELTIETTAASGAKRSYKLTLVSDAAKWTQLATYRYPTAQ